MESNNHKTTLGGIRSILLAILLFGLVGTGAELLFLSHVEAFSQLVPLILIALGLVVIGWHIVSGRSAGLTALRVVMVGFIAAGAAGVGLHYWGSMEFQTETDPSIQGFALFMKVMTSKAPPTLAPGVMAQLGLLGLAYTYRHPAQSEDRRRIT